MGQVRGRDRGDFISVKKIRTKAHDLALLSIQKQFDVFMAGDAKTFHLVSKVMTVWVAKSTRHVGRKFRECIDIQKIGVKRAAQGRGLCRDFLTYVEQYCARSGLGVVHVRTVLSERLKAMLRRRGYKFKNPYGRHSEVAEIRGVGSFYLLPQEGIVSVKTGKKKANADG